ncbi:MAG: TetR/AcrR family transcriptional regulator [Actinomycetota bacterium]
MTTTAPPRTGRPTSRDKILTAACEVVRRDGTASMTLEAVAVEAGVSKGGLLYHFPSKDALQRAMVDRLVQDYAEAERAHVESDPDPVGRSARSYVRAGTDTLHSADVWLALVAALGEGPTLLEPWREYCAGWARADRTEGVDPVSAAIARLAADGLWFADVLGLEAVDPELRRDILLRLEAMTRESA